MGLGKTIQVLALLQRRKYEKNKKSKISCIVVPKSILSNWSKEALKFTPDLKVHLNEGLDRNVEESHFLKHDIILMTYGILRRDILKLKDIHFDYIVLDEAQAIKNDSSQIAKSACLIQAKHKLALTGTPIQNHLGDLFSIFRFLLPSVFYKKISSYKNLREINETADLILKGLRPFILRRTKEEVLKDLPEKTESMIYCDMNKQQTDEYNSVKNYYKTHLSKKIELDGMNKSKIHILEALTRLRQAASHPGLLDPKKESTKSRKIEVLIEKLLIIKSED